MADRVWRQGGLSISRKPFLKLLSVGRMITITAIGQISIDSVGTLVNAAYATFSADPNLANNSTLDSNRVLHLRMYLPVVSEQ
jgi:hypothetical protein